MEIAVTKKDDGNNVGQSEEQNSHKKTGRSHMLDGVWMVTARRGLGWWPDGMSFKAGIEAVGQGRLGKERRRII